MRSVFTRWLAAAVAAVVLAAPAVAADSASRVPYPHVKAHRGDKCVEATDVMRRNHMEFILHQRDETMHKGVRTKQHSLKNCVNCHADPASNSVLGKDGFCQSCHNYAAVTIDCFSCHTDKRSSSAAASTDDSSNKN